MEPTGIILQTFYRTKRYIPRRLQIVMRRIRAHVKLRKHGSIWPIDEKAARPPKSRRARSGSASGSSGG